MSLSNPPKSPDQVDALDAQAEAIVTSWEQAVLHHKDGWSHNETVVKLSALLVEARLKERKELALDTYQGQTFSESTNWQAKFDKFVRNNEYRIKELQQGASAYAESLTASGKQADKSVVRELLRLRKLYDRYELEDTAGHDGNALATWSGYKAFRNPISDRIEEITGVRSDQEVAEWLSQRLPGAVGDDKSSKNASGEELEKQREVTE